MECLRGLSGPEAVPWNCLRDAIVLRAFHRVRHRNRRDRRTGLQGDLEDALDQILGPRPEPIVEVLDGKNA